MRMFKLFMIAVVGFMVSYTLVNMFILHLTIAQFFIIELVITASHAYYNYAKKKLNLVNPI
jgi:hypothetical protein